MLAIARVDHPGGAGPRRVLHIHDMVRRVPRFWRRADVDAVERLIAP